MGEKSWKKKLFNHIIVLTVVLAIIALSFLTADNQRKQWLEDEVDEAGNFTQMYLSKGYISDEAKLTSEDQIQKDQTGELINEPIEKSVETLVEGTSDLSTSEMMDETEVVNPSLETQEVSPEETLYEPQVLHSSAKSPDTKYIAETYGVNKNITAGGFYPSREIRIRELTTNQIVWSMMGSYGSDFFWTTDSRYLAFSFTARIYADTIIVDTKDFTSVMVPIPKQIEENMQEFRPDIYLYAKEWMEDRKLLINFTYTGKDSTEYSGSFIYDLTTGLISTYQSNDSLIDNNPIDLTQMKPVGNISATYVDGCDTLDELAQKAEVIVKGTAGKVISDKQMGVLITVNIENTIKGDIRNKSKLSLLQMKDGNELIEGETYVLALGKDYEEGTYHVIGGYQGIFSMVDNEIYCNESKYLDELKKIMKEENRTAKSKLDLLCDSFSCRIK